MSLEPQTTRNRRNVPGSNPETNFAIGFISNLERICIKHKITIKDISNKTKIPVETITAYFHSEKIATIKQLTELAVAVGNCIAKYSDDDHADITPVDSQIPIGDQIWDYVAAGRTIADAAFKFGLRKYIIADYLKVEKHKRGVPSPKASEIAELQKVRELKVKPDVLKGMSAVELSLKHNLTISVSYSMIRKYGKK